MRKIHEWGRDRVMLPSPCYRVGPRCHAGTSRDPCSTSMVRFVGWSVRILTVPIRQVSQIYSPRDRLRDPALTLHLDHQARERCPRPRDDDILGLGEFQPRRWHPRRTCGATECLRTPCTFDPLAFHRICINFRHLSRIDYRAGTSFLDEGAMCHHQTRRHVPMILILVDRPPRSAEKNGHPELPDTSSRIDR